MEDSMKAVFSTLIFVLLFPVTALAQMEPGYDCWVDWVWPPYPTQFAIPVTLAPATETSNQDLGQVRLPPSNFRCDTGVFAQGATAGCNSGSVAVEAICKQELATQASVSVNDVINFECEKRYNGLGCGEGDNTQFDTVCSGEIEMTTATFTGEQTEQAIQACNGIVRNVLAARGGDYVLGQTAPSCSCPQPPTINGQGQVEFVCYTEVIQPMQQDAYHVFIDEPDYSTIMAKVRASQACESMCFEVGANDPNFIPSVNDDCCEHYLQIYCDWTLIGDVFLQQFFERTYATCGSCTARDMPIGSSESLEWCEGEECYCAPACP